MAVLHKGYRPRIQFNGQYQIGDDINSEYLDSLVNWLMSKIKKSSRPYHEKHTGARNNGKSGKVVSITKDKLRELIIETDGKCSISGNKLYFGPIQVMQNPTDAVRLGLMTMDEKSRRPSADRIDSSLKEYSDTNVQITTMASNLGKGDCDVTTDTSSVVLEYKLAKITIENCTPSYLVDVLNGI